MAYTVSFGTCTKRVNSTSRSYTQVVSASCLLKESTDILRPTFSLSAQTIGDALLTCNYMYVAAFGRYYWITGIQFIHGSWYVSGDVDVLASYKTEIGNTTAYVLRAASQYDEYIPDNLFPMESSVHMGGQTLNVGFDADGVILVCVAGIDSNGQSTQTYYCMDPVYWDAMCGECFTNNFVTAADNAFAGVSNMFVSATFKPEDYISSAIWLPINYSDLTSSIGLPQRVRLGYLELNGILGIACLPNQLLMNKYDTLTIPAHAQASAYGKWMNGNAARKLCIYLPGYGQAVLDADSAVESGSQVSVRWAIDCSGIIHYRVILNGKSQYFSGDISTPVGWGVSRPNITGAIASLGSGIAAAATGNIYGAAMSIGSAALSAVPNVERIVSGGSRVLPALSAYIQLFYEDYYLPSGISFASVGRPLGKTVQIGTLSGFILCHNSASVSCAGTGEEHDRINSFLTGGFYYE